MMFFNGVTCREGARAGVVFVSPQQQILLYSFSSSIDFIPYCKYGKKLLAKFKANTLEHIPGKENRQTDALANLATTLAISQEETTKVDISQKWVVPLVIEEGEEEKEQANIIFLCLVEK